MFNNSIINNESVIREAAVVTFKTNTGSQSYQ